MRSSRSTGRRTNSSAPARMTSMTRSADVLCPVAKMAAPGRARISDPITQAGCSATEVGPVSSTSTMTKSGRRAGASWAACRAFTNSPTMTTEGLAARMRLSAAVESASESTMTVRRLEVMGAPRPSICREIALAKRLPDDLADSRNAGYERELFLLVRAELHEFRGIRTGAREIRLDQLDGHEKEELSFVVLEASATEQHAEDRNVAQDRDLCDRLPNFVVDHPGDREGLPVLEAHVRGSLVLANDRDPEAGRDESLTEIETRHFWPDLQVDGLAVHNHRREQEPDAELFELDADRVSPLSDGVGKLATRQEFGLPAAMGEEIRLRQSSE